MVFGLSLVVAFDSVSAHVLFEFVASHLLVVVLILPSFILLFIVTLLEVAIMNITMRHID